MTPAIPTTSYTSSTLIAEIAELRKENDRLKSAISCIEGARACSTHNMCRHHQIQDLRLQLAKAKSDVRELASWIDVCMKSSMVPSAVYERCRQILSEDKDAITKEGE